MKEQSCLQIRIITKITAIACLLSMMLCYKLWLSERNFPLTPVFDLVHLPPGAGNGLFIISLVLLLCISLFRNPQKFIIVFLIAATLMALMDQNRWQPWFYQYCMMFFVLCFFNFRCDNDA